MTVAILAFVLIPQLFSLLLLQQANAKPKQRETVKSSTQADVTTESPLLESGQSSKLRMPGNNTEIRVISYNIRWRSGDDLKELIKHFREDAEVGSPTIVALQEVDRQKKRTGKTNTIKLIAEELGLYYAWAAPPGPKDGD